MTAELTQETNQEDTSHTSQDIKLVLGKSPHIQLKWSGNDCSNKPAVYLCPGSPAHWQSQCWRAMQQLPGDPKLLPTPSMSALMHGHANYKVPFEQLM